MKYPVISPEEAERLTAEIVAGTAVDVVNSTKWVGSGEEIDLPSLTGACEQLLTDLAEFKRSDEAKLLDLFEGRASGVLHAALEGLPLGVLDDAGFWRYLSIALLWDLVVWRESKAFEKDWTDYRKYVDGRNHAECVPLRMFLRGRLAKQGSDYSLASAVPRGTDLWRSHIVRVRVSYTPPLARGLVEQVADHRITTDDLRSYAKRITRMGSNVVYSVYDEDEITEVLDELRTAGGGS